MKALRVLCAAMLVATASTALAATNTFLGTTYDYNTASNWSLGWVPQAGDRAVVNGGAYATGQYVTLYSAVSTVPDSLTVGAYTESASYWAWAKAYVESGGSLTVGSLALGGYCASGQLIIENGGQVACNGNTSIGIGDGWYAWNSGITINADSQLSSGGAINLVYGNDGSQFLTVNSGTMLLDINPSGSSGNITGIGNVTLDGTLEFDLSDVTAAGGNWTAVDVSTLTETFGDNFGVKYKVGSSVVSATETSSGVWSAAVGGLGTATFTESTGVLSVVPEPGTMAMLVAGLLGLIAYAWRKRS